LNIILEKVKNIKYLEMKKPYNWPSDYAFQIFSKHPGIIRPSFVYDDLLSEDWIATLKNVSTNNVKLLIDIK